MVIHDYDTVRGEDDAEDGIIITDDGGHNTCTGSSGAATMLQKQKERCINDQRSLAKKKTAQMR